MLRCTTHFPGWLLRSSGSKSFNIQGKSLTAGWPAIADIVGKFGGDASGEAGRDKLRM
jgi:hypothetical protein